MGKKAEEKKEYILQQAMKVFAARGYKNVTMKDIIEACNISRGGIYIYFDSTTTIFEEIMKRETDEDNNILNSESLKEKSATQLIKKFFEFQKKELLNQEESLITAIYEYHFANKDNASCRNMNNEFCKATNIVEKILSYGVENGEFTIDSKVAAENIVFTLEGLRLSSTVMNLDESMLDRQFAYIICILGGK